MKILLLASGSGGHVYPAIAYSEYLLENKVDVVMGIVKNGFESRAKFDDRVEKVYYDINTKTQYYKKKPWKILELIRKIKTANKNLDDIDAIISFGGFMSFVAVIIKKQLKCPLFLHEQNATLGDGNQFAARFATKILCVYDKTNCKKQYESKLHVAGNPRSSHAYKYYISQKETKPYRVLFFAGSLGSATLNNLIKETIQKLDDKSIELHVITGAKEYQYFTSLPHQTNTTFYGYVNELTKLMAKMNFVIMRAGATSISEAITLEVPCLLIPSPYVKNDHQNENARYLEKRGAAFVMDEKEVTPEKIIKHIYDLKSDFSAQYNMRLAMQKLKKPNASERMFKVIKDELKL